MQISEHRLRQIILEEAPRRIVEYYIDQEIEALISEDEKADWNAAKWRARKKKLRNAALGALGLGTGLGGLKYTTDQYSDAKSADNAEWAAEREADRQSLAQKKIELETYMNNPAAFRWGVGGESMMQLPGEEGMGGTSVLPASYSVIQQVHHDKKNGTPRYGIPDLDKIPNMTGEQSEGIGDPIKNLQTFFSDFSESQMIDASAELFGEYPKGHPQAGQRKYPHIKRMAASGLESRILMLHPGELDPNYVLPENGMTVKDYYNWAFFNQFLSADEQEMFDMGNPEREADAQTTTQHSVDMTPNKGFTWKESRVTWKNYKNRKKVLA
jgi:hypothetical protein